MAALRNQVTFREPFIPPRARVTRHFNEVALYGLAGLGGLAVITAAMCLFVFAA